MSKPANDHACADSGWRLISTNGKQERLAKHYLRAAGHEVWLPMMVKTSRKGDTFAVPFFPGYLFVRVDDNTSWLSILSTVGVKAVIGKGGGKPAPVPARDFSILRERERDGFMKLDPPPELPCPHKEGDPVKYAVGNEGATIDAVFKERLDKNRCRILVTVIGRARVHTVPLAQVA